jgi:hypothetical protein
MIELKGILEKVMREYTDDKDIGGWW